MPRLFHQPPKYRLHKSTKQAVVSFFGETLYIGPFGSSKSHQRYQELLYEWEKRRHEERPVAKLEDADESCKTDPEKVAASVTTATLREKVKAGSPVTISELILVYRRHTRRYYRKNGEITREAGAIDDVLRLLRKYHGTSYAQEFGPVALDELREKMIDEMDWSRGYLNKQVNRLRGMFKWAASKELIDGSVSTALRELAGLKKGRTRARETAPVESVPDHIIDETLKHLPEVVADMVRIQRLTSARLAKSARCHRRTLIAVATFGCTDPLNTRPSILRRIASSPIGPRAQAILKPYLERADQDFCFSPKESEKQRRASYGRIGRHRSHVGIERERTGLPTLAERQAIAIGPQATDARSIASAKSTESKSGRPIESDTPRRLRSESGLE